MSVGVLKQNRSGVNVDDKASNPISTSEILNN